MASTNSTIYYIFSKVDDTLIAVESASRNLTLDDPDSYEVVSSEPFNKDIPRLLYKGDRDNLSFTVKNYALVNIDGNWKTSFVDYKQARLQMYVELVARITEVGSFSNLSLAERQIASRWFIVGDNERDSVHSFDEQVVNGSIYNAESIKAREARMTACMMQVYNRLTHDQVNEVCMAMNFDKTTYNYIKRGCEGTLEGNDEGLFDYIMARVGTTWELTGLRIQAYIPKGMADCAELAAKLIDILRNGNY